MQKTIRKEIDFSGKKFILETGEMAQQANGSVLATLGETVVLATAVSQPASSDVDYFPLSVEYEEKLYAGGRISTSRFIKRENRPSEKAILNSRLIDRSIRPIFPKDYQAEVQVIITVLSVDLENDPDIVSLMAVSAALAISDIPWNGPLVGFRVGRVNDQFVLNPTEEQKTQSDLNLVIVSSKDGIVMIEATAGEVEEEVVIKAAQLASKESNKLFSILADFVKEAGKEKQKYEHQAANEKELAKILDFVKVNIMKDFDAKSQDEGWFDDSLKILEKEFLTPESDKEITAKVLANILEEQVASYLREEILTNKIRPDGRSPGEIREINTKVGVLPRTHGSAIFQRGETQALSIVTLGPPALEQLIEGMEGEATKRYMHHYNFPPFSVGEVRRRGTPARREIGHGALAEKAILPVIPALEEFPYTVRVVSEILSSAGSTSMASACGSTLALMDAGVPIKEPVAGISIGLITDKKNPSKYELITDIAYQEDAQGDMDFKVAGTKNGITAIQLDTKLSGVPLEIIGKALQEAKKARALILKKMLETISTSRENISQYAPKVVLIKIDPSKIGDVIGSGGRIINKIIAETGAAIDINDEGIVTISSKDLEACKKASSWIEGIVKEIKPGEFYEGKVTRILPFGAFVEFLPGREGLVHISNLAAHRVNKVEDIAKVGQSVDVKVMEIDDQGRINLTMRLSEEQQSSPPRRDFPKRDFGRKQNFNRKPQKRRY